MPSNKQEPGNDKAVNKRLPELPEDEQNNTEELKEMNHTSENPAVLL